jgi:microcystin-dependent protein
MADPFLGEIRMVGWNFASNGWALCNGQLMSISQNAALFSLLGTYYGGDGIQTFALPNLQSRVPIHQGTGPGLSTYTIGQASGSENITLLANQMPQHNHLVGVSNLTGSVADPTNALLAQGNSVRGGPRSSPPTTFRRLPRALLLLQRFQWPAAICRIAISSPTFALTSSSRCRVSFRRAAKTVVCRRHRLTAHLRTRSNVVPE